MPIITSSIVPEKIHKKQHLSELGEPGFEAFKKKSVLN